MFYSLSKRYGGINIKGIVKRVKKYNSRGIAISVAYLPIKQENSLEIDKHIKEYTQILDIIYKNKLDCDITIHLNQFGIYGGVGLAKKSIEPILQKATETNNFVWIDMGEGAIDESIEVFKQSWKNYKNIGLCLQAYLKRTRADLEQVLKNKVPVRLVKGYYKADDFKTWDEVTQNYASLMEILLSKSSHGGIATHDLDLIEKTKNLINNKLHNMEFHMFCGVRDKLAISLVKQGYRVRLYMFYGNLFTYFLNGFSTFDNSRNIQRFFGFKKIR